ncbi:ead/Ea22-like family protein [Enterobacter hormaechei]|nr:ead/Ea22-like family protein [Enterobacter hormaechei]MCW4974513.1 ead/Ea22-like family protein [Enterobacter hormaechei subsp. xiangfangensis]MDY3566126.1 ead/Ea22-like family protein [Enterobacter hormaechei]
MFAYAVQVAVLELRKVRNEAAALAAENAGLKNAITAVSKTSEECEINGDELKYVVEPSEFDALTDLLDETPVTDAFMAEMRAQAHKEGAHFVANRMLAAWEAGFIDDTAKNAADIARMILTSTEFMADAPEGDFDRSFADGVLEDIAAQLRKGVQS